MASNFHEEHAIKWIDLHLQIRWEGSLNNLLYIKLGHTKQVSEGAFSEGVFSFQNKSSDL